MVARCFCGSRISCGKAIGTPSLLNREPLRKLLAMTKANRQRQRYELQASSPASLLMATCAAGGDEHVLPAAR